MTTPESARTQRDRDDRALRRVIAGAVSVSPSTALALLDRAQQAEAALTPLAPEVPPRRFARGLVNTPADQIELLRQALDTVARIHHGLHDGRFDDCERDTCRRSRRALAVAALDLAATRTPEPPDSGDGWTEQERATYNVAIANGLVDRARLIARIADARLRSGSPAPEGGE